MTRPQDERSQADTIWAGQLAQAEAARSYNRSIASLLVSHLGKRILEVGVGMGNVTEFLVGQSETYVGIDLVAEHVRIASERFARHSFEAFVADVESPGYLDLLRGKAIDSIVSVNCFEHLSNDESVLTALCEWAPPGTRFAFLVPAHQRLYGSLDVQAEHFRRYGRREFAATLQRAGFRVDGTRYFNVIGALAWLVAGSLTRGRNAGHTGQSELQPIWRLLYRGLSLARYALTVEFALEAVAPPPFGLSLIAWGAKNG